jgi:hypothetical protein
VRGSSPRDCTTLTLPLSLAKGEATPFAKCELEEITERKKSLAVLMSNIAEIGAANAEQQRESRLSWQR